MPAIGAGGERKRVEGEINKGWLGNLGGGEVVIMAKVEGKVMGVVGVHVLWGDG